MRAVPCPGPRLLGVLDSASPLLSQLLWTQVKQKVIKEVRAATCAHRLMVLLNQACISFHHIEITQPQ